jgi:hypothetical protein
MHRAEPVEMDAASFLESISDMMLRAEVMLGADDNVVATLPPQLAAEARLVSSPPPSSSMITLCLEIY